MIITKYEGVLMATVAELLVKNREREGVSQEELAERLSVPVEIVRYIEGEKGSSKPLAELLADTLEVALPVFLGKEEPPKPEPTKEEIKAEAVANAKYPSLRDYLLSEDRCGDHDLAIELFDGKEFSLAEKNLTLYLSTTALYNFCSTHSSSFKFDEYLFKLHGKLLVKYEANLKKESIPEEEKEERLANARSNIFGCDSMENIAVRVLEPFAEELEEKLSNGINDFDDDIDGPFSWIIDKDLMQINIMKENGEKIHSIKLLDVKKQ